jgi:hypothetical protein
MDSWSADLGSMWASAQRWWNDLQGWWAKLEETYSWLDALVSPRTAFWVGVVITSAVLYRGVVAVVNALRDNVTSGQSHNIYGSDSRYDVGDDYARTTFREAARLSSPPSYYPTTMANRSRYDTPSSVPPGHCPKCGWKIQKNWIFPSCGCIPAGGAPGGAVGC